MKKFNQGRDRNFNDRGSNRGPVRSGFGGGRGDTSMMHSAVCFECGKDCEVPFKPSGSKPVFCSFCFGNKQDSEKRSDNKFERGGSFKSRFDNNKKEANNPKIDEVISRLDRIIKLLSSTLEIKKEKIQEIKPIEKMMESIKTPKASAKKKTVAKKKTAKTKK